MLIFMLSGEGELSLKKAGRIVLWMLGALLTLVLMALACAALILSRPEEESADSSSVQPLLGASSALHAEEENDLPDLVSAFPIPVMSFMSGSGLLFVSATSGDIGLEGGFGRMATLHWQTPSGDPVTLQSIYPASALSLIGKGNYHFVQAAGPALLGLTSVRMENAETVRLHVATDLGLYAVTVPNSLSNDLSSLCRSIQLFTAD